MAMEDEGFSREELRGAIRFTEQGEEAVQNFTERDNLIVKGENLQVLNALRHSFLHAVRLIYIDPPYNTGKRHFQYEDSRSREFWSSSMKERLLAAKLLMVRGGVICIQINIKEMAGLKLLCDEIFGEENYVNMVTVKVATTASYRSINDCPVNVSEYILIYTNDRSCLQISPVYVRSCYSEDYGSYIEDFDGEPEDWKIVSVNQKIYESKGVTGLKEFRSRYGSDWKEIRRWMKAEFCRAHQERIVSLNTLQKPAKRILELQMRSRQERGRVFCMERKAREPIYLYNGRSLAFYSKKFHEIDGESVPAEILTNIWDDISFLSLGVEGGVSLPNGKKPERLIQRLIQLFASEEDDIVMDFYLGSGTTCAAAHKMGRRYVGVEECDYGKNDCVVRLRNVIAGEQSGISKSMGWNGGGSFVCVSLFSEKKD